MEKLTTLTGVAVPLRRSNVDTHQNMEYHASYYPPFQGRYQTSPICLTAALFAIVAMRQVHSVKTSRR